MTTNRKWTMAERPVGEPTPECFAMREETLPELSDGEVLIENHWLSLDPYMRGRMRDAESYAPPLQVGDIITGETCGVIAASRSERWAEGDHVCLHRGWQTHAVVGEDAPGMMRIDPSLAPPEAWLGVVGMPGRTAWVGLTDIGKPQAGETLVVSAASGAVGSVVGQMGKILGLRVIGVAGGEEKCSWCTDEAGFDACVDYKGGNLEADLAAACPDGVDIYFENVGGAVSRAVAPLLNAGARVPICGYISLYNSEETDFTKVETPMSLFASLSPPPENRFFVVTEAVERWPEISRELAGWIADGRLIYRQTVSEGFESAPQAFISLLNGGNFGKQLVKIV